MQEGASVSTQRSGGAAHVPLTLHAHQASPCCPLSILLAPASVVGAHMLTPTHPHTHHVHFTWERRLWPEQEDERKRGAGGAVGTGLSDGRATRAGRAGLGHACSDPGHTSADLPCSRCPASCVVLMVAGRRGGSGAGATAAERCPADCCLRPEDDDGRACRGYVRNGYVFVRGSSSSSSRNSMMRERMASGSSSHAQASGGAAAIHLGGAAAGGHN